MKKSHIVILVIFVVLLLDQWLKIYIKTNFTLEEDVAIFGLSWARLYFTENEGMAFGIKMAGEYGKLFLSIFRIIAVAFLGHFIYRLIKANESVGLLISFTLILAGALGNVIDCLAYGVIFEESTYHGNPAQLFPAAGGYAPVFYGKVVDMLYFPMVDTILPEWVPFWGGERFQFFRFIFNIADASITVGVASMLLFHRHFLKADPKTEEVTTKTEEQTAEQTAEQTTVATTAESDTNHTATAESSESALSAEKEIDTELNKPTENPTDPSPPA